MTGELFHLIICKLSRKVYMSYQIQHFQTYPNIFQNYQLTVWMCCLLVLAKLTIPEHSDTYYSKKHDLNLKHEIFSFKNNQNNFSWWILQFIIYILWISNLVIPTCGQDLYITHMHVLCMCHTCMYIIYKNKHIILTKKCDDL